MKKHTYQQRLVAGLQALGCQQVASKNRYLIFRYDHHDGGYGHYLVGKYGALRHSRTGAAVGSVSMGDNQNQTKTYKDILALGDKALGTSSNSGTSSPQTQRESGTPVRELNQEKG